MMLSRRHVLGFMGSMALGATLAPRSALAVALMDPFNIATAMDSGVAIAVKVFVKRQLQTGSLIAPFDTVCYSGEAYFLTWPKTSLPSPPLTSFLDWMRETIRTESAL